MTPAPVRCGARYRQLGSGLLLAALLLAALLLWACASRQRKPPPDPWTPAQTTRLFFPHAIHQEQEIRCQSCHREVVQDPPRESLRHVQKKDCAECHDVQDKRTCTLCHRRSKQPARPEKADHLDDSQLHFSHGRHISRAKDCLACHATVAVASSLSQIPRPKMHQDCFACHEHLQDYRQLQCRRCHQSLSRYPIKAISAFNHEGNFFREHGRWAKSQSDLCLSCHTQSSCAECHSQRAVVVPSQRRSEAVDRTFIHRGDWLSRHAMESRSAPGSCTRCHSEKRCQHCHRAQGISANMSNGTGRGRSPHAPDWVVPGSPNHHGFEARRRIAQCASCHDQGSLSNCIRCHRSVSRGGLGIRPHPPGWRRSGKTKDRMCLFCH